MVSLCHIPSFVKTVMIPFISQVNIRGAENLGEELYQLLQLRDLNLLGGDIGYMTV